MPKTDNGWCQVITDRNGLVMLCDSDGLPIEGQGRLVIDQGIDNKFVNDKWYCEVTVTFNAMVGTTDGSHMDAIKERHRNA